MRPFGVAELGVRLLFMKRFTVQLSYEDDSVTEPEFMSVYALPRTGDVIAFEEIGRWEVAHVIFQEAGYEFNVAIHLKRI